MAHVKTYDPADHKPENISRKGVCAWGRVHDYECDRTPLFTVSQDDGLNIYSTCDKHVSGALKYLVGEESKARGK